MLCTKTQHGQQMSDPAEKSGVMPHKLKNTQHIKAPNPAFPSPSRPTIGSSAQSHSANYLQLFPNHVDIYYPHA